jgi:hypothetical protein
MHDATKVLMGTTQSSFRDVDNKKGSIEAGKLVRLKSDDTLSSASADGSAIGISLGKSLSDTARTAICRSGIRVPIKLTAAFSPAIGAQVNVSDTTGLAIAAGAGATAINAVYSSGALTAILEDGTEVAAIVAYVDMPGGV